jgi:hypothetical protein
LFLGHVLDEVRVQGVSLELTKLGEDFSHGIKQPPMMNEKKYDGVGELIRMLLEETLVRKRNVMMGEFTGILRRIPTTMDAPYKQLL